jgi:hypothetical protein
MGAGASVERIKARESALEFPIGYVDRAASWWTDHLDDLALVDKVHKEILPQLWQAFDRAIARGAWSVPEELIRRLDDIAALANTEAVRSRVAQAKQALLAYTDP